MQYKDEFLDKIRKIRCYGKINEKMPHKPLLILLAMSRLKHCKIYRLDFRHVEIVLEPLINKYARSNTNARSNDPFMRLEYDGIWQAEAGDRANLYDASGSARKTILRDRLATAGFTNEVIEILQENPLLIDEATKILLDMHFPCEQHEEVLKDVNLKLDIY